jgi:dinuclear metal center YbgI/SA1388 family protein
MHDHRGRPDTVRYPAAVMDRLAQWIDALHAAYPPAHAADWDTVGLHVGDPDDPVSAVLVALDVTRAVLDEARRRSADLLIAHHPLLFRPLPRLTPGSAAGGLALHAARARVAVLAAHTNVDAALPGTSEPVCELLGLRETAPLEPLADRPELGLGRVGVLPRPLTLGGVADRIATRLPSPHLRVGGPLDRAVTRVAVCGGAGGSLVEAALDAGADVFVTGDLRHHVALDAQQRGLALIDAGHHATEVAAMPAMRERLAHEAATRGLQARLLASSEDTDPWSPYCPHRRLEG